MAWIRKTQVACGIRESALVRVSNSNAAFLCNRVLQDEGIEALVKPFANSIGNRSAATASWENKGTAMIIPGIRVSAHA